MPASVMKNPVAFAFAFGGAASSTDRDPRSGQGLRPYYYPVRVAHARFWDAFCMGGGGLCIDAFCMECPVFSTESLVRT